MKSDSESCSVLTIIPEEKPHYAGFTSSKQEKMYHDFVAKALELLQDEILYRRLGSDIIKSKNFHPDQWEREVLKIYQALNMMEQYKQASPFLSQSFEQLAEYVKGRSLKKIGSELQNSSNGNLQEEKIGIGIQINENIKKVKLNIKVGAQERAKDQREWLQKSNQNNSTIQEDPQAECHEKEEILNVVIDKDKRGNSVNSIQRSLSKKEDLTAGVAEQIQVKKLKTTIEKNERDDSRNNNGMRACTTNQVDQEPQGTKKIKVKKLTAGEDFQRRCNTAQGQTKDNLERKGSSCDRKMIQSNQNPLSQIGNQEIVQSDIRVRNISRNSNPSEQKMKKQTQDDVTPHQTSQNRRTIQLISSNKVSPLGKKRVSSEPRLLATSKKVIQSQNFVGRHLIDHTQLNYLYLVKNNSVEIFDNSDCNQKQSRQTSGKKSQSVLSDLNQTLTSFVYNTDNNKIVVQNSRSHSQKLKHATAFNNDTTEDDDLLPEESSQLPVNLYFNNVHKNQNVQSSKANDLSQQDQNLQKTMPRVAGKYGGVGQLKLNPSASTQQMQLRSIKMRQTNLKI